jgi:hypothetical protein
MIKHEIYSSRSVPDPSFPNEGAITEQLEKVFGYTDWVAASSNGGPRGRDCRTTSEPVARARPGRPSKKCRRWRT